MRLRDFSLPVSAILLCAVSGLATASTITFSAAAGQPVNNFSFTNCTGPFSGSGSAPIAFSSTCGGANGTGTGSGGADFGHAGAMATVIDFSSAVVQMAGGASFSDDSFIFTATGPGAPNSIPVSLNLALAGIINTTPGADAIVDIQVFLDGTMSLFHLVHSGGSVFQCVSTFAGNAGCGAGQFLGTTLTTGQVFVPLNQPVGLQVLIQVTAEAVSGGASSTVDFSHSLDFPIGSDLFNLPAGFTVNEPGMFVFDNHFQPNAVPEPGSLVLLGTGLVGLAGAMRRKLRA